MVLACFTAFTANCKRDFTPPNSGGRSGERDAANGGARSRGQSKNDNADEGLPSEEDGDYESNMGTHHGTPSAQPVSSRLGIVGLYSKVLPQTQTLKKCVFLSLLYFLRGHAPQTMRVTSESTTSVQRRPLSGFQEIAASPLSCSPVPG